MAVSTHDQKINMILGHHPFDHFFRLTGRIWLGPLITSMIFIMVLISNTVFYLPI